MMTINRSITSGSLAEASEESVAKPELMGWNWLRGLLCQGEDFLTEIEIHSGGRNEDSPADGLKISIKISHIHGLFITPFSPARTFTAPAS